MVDGSVEKDGRTGSVEGRVARIYSARPAGAASIARPGAVALNLRSRYPLSVLSLPILVYLGVLVGAAGVWIALPRRGFNPQIIGALAAGLGLGIAFVGLRWGTGESGPDIYFYIFAFLGLGASLRMISHPKPVYAALYFIMTILSSAGLYLLLSAEFMAFALIIIYAGAILITYLFVIMLATQAPTAESMERLSDYDRSAREPLLSTIAGFMLIAALTGLGARGLADPPQRLPFDTASLVDRLPGRAAATLREAGLRRSFDVEAIEDGVATVSLSAADAGAVLESIETGAASEPLSHMYISSGADGTLRFRIPPESIENIEAVGWTLVAGHPLGLELAGVILMMALVGAVVLARKQIEIEEERKRIAAHAHGLTGEGGAP